MKKKMMFCVGILLISNVIFSQTGIIAAKSRGLDNVQNEDDNYGIVPGIEYRDVDSVKYFKKENRVIEYRTDIYTKIVYSDTIILRSENDTTFSIIRNTLEGIRNNPFYPSKVKFIDFPKDFNINSQGKGKSDKSGISLWFIFLSLLLLVGTKTIEKRKNEIQKQ